MHNTSVGVSYMIGVADQPLWIRNLWVSYNYSQKVRAMSTQLQSVSLTNYFFFAFGGAFFLVATTVAFGLGCVRSNAEIRSPSRTATPAHKPSSFDVAQLVGTAVPAKVLTNIADMLLCVVQERKHLFLAVDVMITSSCPQHVYHKCFNFILQTNHHFSNQTCG